MTTYLASSVTKEDADAANKYMTSIDMEAWNTRLMRTKEGHFDIRLAAGECGGMREFYWWLILFYFI